MDRPVVDSPVALVVGAGSGIGAATAARLSQDGFTVIAAGRRKQPVTDVARDIERSGGSAIAVQLDAAEPGSVNDAVSEITRALGHIEVLAHCAGVNAPPVGIEEMTDEDWTSVLRTNLDGSFFVARAVARVMIPARTGAMIFIASDRALYGAKRRPHYAASKAGQIALMRSLALELGPFGITANVINPGTTDTKMAREHITEHDLAATIARDPLGRISQPEEIAELVAFLAGPGRFMTGQLVTTRVRTG